MSDADALLRAVLLAPEDDAPRLVYADWLDEHGQPERAEFVRVQCELARLDAPPIVISESCVLSKRYGPNYYTLSGGETTEGGGRLIMEVKIGDRIDVPNRKYGKPLFGLRVHKIDNRGLDEIIVVKDAKSKPWPGEPLRRRERELWTANAVRWLPDLPGLHRVIAGWTRQVVRDDGENVMHGQELAIRAEPRRGFVDELRCSLAAFLGVKCHTCRGEGYVTDHRPMPGGVHSTSRKCHTCDGSKFTTPGVVGVFAREPVTRVVLTDKTPFRYRDRPSFFGWSRDRPTYRDDPSEVLPPELFDQLVPTGNFWPSADAALAALSAACVKCGRERAGSVERTTTEAAA